jgi:two-component system sporulation sensor kinase A
MIFSKEKKVLNIFQSSEKNSEKYEKYIGMDIGELFQKHTGRLFSEAFSKCRRGEYPEFEYLHEDDGKSKWFHARFSPLTTEGSFSGAVAVVRDVTQRKKDEMEIKSSEELYRALIKASPEAVTVTDLQANVIDLSDKTAKLHNFKDIEEMKGVNAFQMISPRYHDAAVENMKKVINGETITAEYMFLRKDGSEFLGELIATSINDHTGRPKAFLATTRDITEKREAEEALKESEEKFRSLAENSPNMIFIINMAGHLLYTNSRYYDVMGYTERDLYSPHFNFMNMIAPEYHEIAASSFAEHRRGNDMPSAEFVLLTRNGDAMDVIVSTKLIDYKGSPAILGVVTDITEKKRADIEVRQAQRLSAIGQLAAGVAHEVNNPLAALSGELQWLMEKTEDKKLGKSLSFMLKICDRIAVIVNNLLVFSRESFSAEKKNLKVEKAIEDTTKLIEKRFDLSNIRILRKYDKSLPKVNMNKGQIEQVILNVLLNSADAMPEGGTITITTRQSRDSKSVEIVIKDTGTGINEENLGKIFDPFYSTKSPDKGTGLGLSVSHGIIKSHSGEISAKSKKGRGTEVMIKLPVKGEGNGS